jgi:hypothetical protein
MAASCYLAGLWHQCQNVILCKVCCPESNKIMHVWPAVACKRNSLLIHQPLHVSGLWPKLLSFACQKFWHRMKTSKSGDDRAGKSMFLLVRSNFGLGHFGRCVHWWHWCSSMAELACWFPKSCYCTNSSNEWNVQSESARRRRMSARTIMNKEWDSSFALSLCSVGNEVLYTADQMIRRSDTLYLHRAITTRANTMTKTVHSIVHSNN